MWRQDRPVIEKFEPSELLYRRCVKNDLAIDDENELWSITVEFPAFSVNRELQSEPMEFRSAPEDVLIPPDGKVTTNIELMGVVQFPVSAVPGSLTPLQGGATVNFRIEHLPEDDNYSHSEVRAYKGGVLATSVSETVKKDFRSEIARHATIHKQPQI
jgi:hypothetical protein